MSSPAEQQVLRYAADLARLYAQAGHDRERLQRLETALVAAAEGTMALVRALSQEEAAQRLAALGVSALGLESCAVYLVRRERLVLLARSPERASFPMTPAVRLEDLKALDGEPDELEGPPWADLVGGGAAVAIPLRGRRREVGVLVGVGLLRHLHAPDEAALAQVLSLIAGHGGVVLENLALEERRETGSMRLDRSAAPRPLPGRSTAMAGVERLVKRLARVDSSVLLTGETGTGKTMLAKQLHDASGRAAKPFVTINCGAIPEALVESELFGHEAGAFTGAQRAHRGKVEQADGGTLFLDEVGDLPLAVQVKLLTFVEERRYARVGGERELQADVRVISATNRDLAAAVDEGAFRQDLLYRLEVFRIEVPPLRERGQDVLDLARTLAAEVARRYELPAPRWNAEVDARLRSYSWPGNVRELRNVMEKAVILSDGGPVQVELLPRDDAGPARAAPEPVLDDASPTPRAPTADGDASASPAEGSAKLAAAAGAGGVGFSEAKSELIRTWETSYFESVLRITGGNVAHAARMAQIDKKNLHRKVKEHGIDLDAIRAAKAAEAPSDA